jgi:stearoyl-CoA desaturase (delta-9 desaturase)
MGIYEGQPDVGWWVLLFLKKLGLVWDVKLPQDLPFREELKAIPTNRKSQVEYSQSNS